MAAPQGLTTVGVLAMILMTVPATRSIHRNSAVFGTPRSATVIARAPSVLLALDVADFRRLAGWHPEIVTVIDTEGRRRRAVDTLE